MIGLFAGSVRISAPEVRNPVVATLHYVHTFESLTTRRWHERTSNVALPTTDFLRLANRFLRLHSDSLPKITTIVYRPYYQTTRCHNVED
jgi:hypothetical protein